MDVIVCICRRLRLQARVHLQVTVSMQARAHFFAGARPFICFLLFVCLERPFAWRRKEEELELIAAAVESLFSCSLVQLQIFRVIVMCG